MTTITNTDALRQLLKDLTTNSCDFLVGAGISMISPSKLPSGNELKELIINNLFDTKELRHFLNLLKKNEKYNYIIPEVIFQEVYSIVGDRIFEIYEILKLSEPNNIHQLLAKFSNSYDANIYTTNFDILIDQFVLSKNKVQHLHGSLDNPIEMTILVHQVGKGVDKANANQFYLNTNSRNLYVFGYSGNDKDIIDLINNSKIKNIYWLVRDITDQWTIKNISGIQNKSVYIFEGDLDKFSLEVIKKLKLKVINFKYIDRSKERVAIISKYQSGHSLFERFATLELTFFRIQEFKLAMEVSKLALTLKASLKENEILWIYIALSDAIRIIGKEFNVGHKYVDKGLSFSNIDNYPFLKGRLHNVKGLLILECKHPKPNEAIPHFENSINAFKVCLRTEKNPIEKLKIEDYIARIYNNLGLSYSGLSNFNSAIQNYKNSLKIKYKLGNIIGLSTTQVNLSLCYLKKGNKKASLIWENKALHYIKKYNLYYREAYLLREKGQMLNEEDGLKALNSALEIYQKHIPNAFFDIELTLQAIAKLNKK